MLSDVYARCMAEPSSLTRPGLSQLFLYIFITLSDQAIIFVAAVTWHQARESSRAMKTTTETPSSLVASLTKSSPPWQQIRGNFGRGSGFQGLSCSTMTGDSSAVPEQLMHNNSPVPRTG